MDEVAAVVGVEEDEAVREEAQEEEAEDEEVLQRRSLRMVRKLATAMVMPTAEQHKSAGLETSIALYLANNARVLT